MGTYGKAHESHLIVQADEIEPGEAYPHSVVQWRERMYPVGQLVEDSESICGGLRDRDAGSHGSFILMNAGVSAHKSSRSITFALSGIRGYGAAEPFIQRICARYQSWAPDQ